MLKFFEYYKIILCVKNVVYISILLSKNHFDILMFYDSGMSILRAYVVKIFDEIFSNEGRDATSMMGNLFRPHSYLVRIYVRHNIH